jgi:hypothetical protein
MRIYRYVGSFLLGAALIAPAGMLAGTNFQDDHHQDDKHRVRHGARAHNVVQNQEPELLADGRTGKTVRT